MNASCPVARATSWSAGSSTCPVGRSAAARLSGRCWCRCLIRRGRVAGSTRSKTDCCWSARCDGSARSRGLCLTVNWWAPKLPTTMPRDRERDAVEPEEAPPVPRTAPDEPPGVGKSAEAILASIQAPLAEGSPLEQPEQTIRHPKKLIYIAMSNRNFYWRTHVSKPVLDEGYVPINPFMLFDYYLLHTVPKQLVREAINNLLARCDEVWVFGTMSLGVKVQLGIAKRLKKPLRFYDIADLPEQVYRISEKLAQEEGRDGGPRPGVKRRGGGAPRRREKAGRRGPAPA